MRVRRKLNGQAAALDDAALLRAGGEARIYRWPDDPELAAKIWRKPSSERQAKVAVMLSNPPIDPMARRQHSSIAWPVDILENPSGGTVGFLMPYMAGMSPAAGFFNPPARRQACPLFSWLYLHRTARNLAAAVRALHDRGCLLGGFHEGKVLVSETALVSIVDTDSFQVRDAKKGMVYRCEAGKPEFTPPELQGKPAGLGERKIEQDLFGLGVILFQLLMEGTHPFAGSYAGKGPPGTYPERIAKGHFPYASGAPVPYAPERTAPPFEILHPSLRHLFARCFQDGHARPGARPDAQAWQWTLEEAEAALVSCWVNDRHVYSGHLEECPWCARIRLLGGPDPFPSAASVREGTHLEPAAAPPKMPGQPRPVAEAGSPALPPPPFPGKMPFSAESPAAAARAKRFAGFAGPRNGLAWAGLAAGAAAWIAVLPAPGLVFLLGAAGLILSIFGEVRSHRWRLDGKGRIPARAGILLSIGPVIWFFISNRP